MPQAKSLPATKIPRPTHYNSKRNNWNTTLLYLLAGLFIQAYIASYINPVNNTSSQVEKESQIMPAGRGLLNAAKSPPPREVKELPAAVEVKVG